MIKHGLNDLYFNWMYQLVCNKRNRLSYQKLLTHLHNINFTYILDMDNNRAEDGIDLRYRFEYENGYIKNSLNDILRDKPCSILEMMISLSFRCEDVMSDPEYNNRLDQWFWNMLKSLGLHTMDDDRFNPNKIDKTIMIFLNRDYQPNGQGGLFTLKKPKYDLRQAEIWYQMCWYLDEFLSN